MRKRKKGRKFSREKSQRKAFLRALISALILHEKIRTTEARAKETASLSAKYITRAKKGDLHSRRLLARYFAPNVAKKLIDELGPRYKSRPGGYSRIIKLGPRSAEGAKMAIIELIK